MSESKFPKIGKTQVALARADCLTGQVLRFGLENFREKKALLQRRSHKDFNKDFNEFLAAELNKKEEMFTIFNSLDEAIEYIDENKSSYPNVEFYVKDCNNKLIYSYNVSFNGEVKWY